MAKLAKLLVINSAGKPFSSLYAKCLFIISGINDNISSGNSESFSLLPL